MQIGCNASSFISHSFFPFLLVTMLASFSLLSADVTFGLADVPILIYATLMVFLSYAMKSHACGIKCLGIGLCIVLQALSLLPLSLTSLLFPVLISKISGFYLIGVAALSTQYLSLLFPTRGLFGGILKQGALKTDVMTADLCVFVLGLIILIILDKRTSVQYQSQINALNQKIQALTKQMEEVKTTAAETIASTQLSFCTFSHELRNPLNGMGGIITLLADRVLDPVALVSLKKAKLCLQIMKNLLNSVLDSGKLERGTLELNLAPVSVTEFFDGVWTICSDLIASKGLRPILKISKNVPKYLNIDSQRITQAILNIVSNAVKYTTTGSVSIIVSWKRDSPVADDYSEDSFCDNDGSSILENTARITFGKYRSIPKFLGDQYVTLNNENACLSERAFTLDQPQGNVKGILVIKITDTGCGMNEAQQQRLFQKFSQVSADPQLRSTGVGLGLWITKSLIKSMGGDIHLYSKEMEGSSFDLKIPAEADESYSKLSHYLDTEISINNSTGTRASHNLKKLSVAIIDSSTSERLRMKQKLQKTGIASAIEEFDGEAKLSRYLNDLSAGRSTNFDVTIIGVDQRTLPGMTACWDKLSESTSPAIKSKIIFAIAEDITTNDRERFTQAGKPKIPLRTISRTAGESEIQKALTDVMKSYQKILIADDDSYNLEIMGSFINKLGYQCLKASNGREAIEIFQRHSKEIKTIFFDNEMPELNGLEAGQQINRLICTDNADNVAMYLLTGSLDTELKKRAREIGFKETLTKPFEYENLAKLLK